MISNREQDFKVRGWNKDFADLKDRFLKITIIGKGTYGCVYKASPLSDPTKIYALKKIQLFKEKDGFPITALREIKILQAVNHRNVLRLVDIMCSKSSEPNSYRMSTFLILEYMEHDFVSLIPSVEFSMREIKCLMKQLLEGCAFLHSQKIIHRDLKSGNLLMNNKGEIKIADFGMARYFYNPNNKLTKNVVTFWYRSPELFFGERNYTNKVDIWSIGCIFAEMLTKKVLFNANEAKDQMEKMYQRLGHPEEAWPEVKELPYYNDLKPKLKYTKTLGVYIRDINPEVDQSCVDLLERLLAYNPKNRLSAESALKHPFFSSEPLPCEPHQIQKLTKEYHDYMIRSMNKEREKKLYKERLEQERKEQETYRRKWDEKKKDNSNASSFKRLASLFGPQKDQEEEESSSSSEDEDIPPGDHLGKRRP